jgi:hypothetical protein
MNDPAWKKCPFCSTGDAFFESEMPPLTPMKTNRQYMRHLFKRRAAGVSQPVLSQLRAGKLIGRGGPLA